MDLKKSETSFYQLLKRLWHHLTRRRQLVLLMGLMLVSALIEVISLSTVLPFLGILTAPDRVFNHTIVKDLALSCGISFADQLVLPLTVAFIAVALLAGGIRILLLWVSSRLAYACGSDLSINLYRRTLYQPYQVHIARNSSIVLGGISKVNVTVNMIYQFLTLTSSTFVVVSILFVLIVIDPLVASVAAIYLGISYGLISFSTRKRLARNSERIATGGTQLFKVIQEGLGGIRDVLLDGTQSVYCDFYRKVDLPLRRAEGINTFIAQSPRYVMEAMVMVMIAALTYGLRNQPGGIAALLPVLGSLAFGAQRLLPALQQIYGAWASFSSGRASLSDTLALLDQPLPTEIEQPAPSPLSFLDSICFRDVRFRYSSDEPYVIDGLNLTIRKGSRVGFVGRTGSGKSTTLDLLMGLLVPTEGELLVDGQPISGNSLRSWQRAIAHVPQSIYLADITLAENIAFGVPAESIDLDRVRLAAKQAQIAEFIEERPEGYDAIVGERGIRLSGGQRQRIGIARALYKQASVLVFDEATSALDSATEKSVMEAIEGLNRDLTILIIAHRLTTVQRCDYIVEMEQGRLVAHGDYKHLLKSSPSFQNLSD